MKAMTKVKEPVRCKLEIAGRMVEQVMEFRFVSIILGDLTKTMKSKIKKQQSTWLISSGEYM